MVLRNIQKLGLWPVLLSGMALLALVLTVWDLRREYAFTHRSERHPGFGDAQGRWTRQVYLLRVSVGRTSLWWMVWSRWFGLWFFLQQSGRRSERNLANRWAYVSDVGDNPGGALQHVLRVLAVCVLAGFPCVVFDFPAVGESLTVHLS